jgi:hypothetical protein
MASGVQGIIDLTVPGGGSSLSMAGADEADGTADERSDCGWMNRILQLLLVPVRQGY